RERVVAIQGPGALAGNWRRHEHVQDPAFCTASHEYSVGPDRANDGDADLWVDDESEATSRNRVDAAALVGEWRLALRTAIKLLRRDGMRAVAIEYDIAVERDGLLRGKD